MSANNIVKAWKDEEFLAALEGAERAALPDNPAGAIELPDGALDQVNGGASFLSFCRTVCGVYCTITRQYSCMTI
jgi:mersacidin/lichenicidin family type 2 lantibiotic